MVEYEEKPLDFMYEQIMKIMISINQDDNLTMLNETDLLLKILPEEFKKENQMIELETEIQKVLNDKEDLRLLRIIQKVKAEADLSIEYYDMDRGDDHRLFYREKTEAKFFKLQEKIREALSKIIKQKLIEDIDYD